MRSLLLFTLFLLFPASAAFPAEIPFILPPEDELAKLKMAILFTDKGEIEFELYPEEAPWHVANFKYLADKGFYRNRRFHLHYKDYIIQTGALHQSEKAVYGYLLPPEFGTMLHEEGTLGMARLPDQKNPQRLSSGTQFHILLDSNRKMDHSYTIFGRVTDGMEVLGNLRKGDLIRDLKVFVRE